MPTRGYQLKRPHGELSAAMVAEHRRTYPIQVWSVNETDLPAARA
jgi:hypothetical protein